VKNDRIKTSSWERKDNIVLFLIQQYNFLFSYKFLFSLPGHLHNPENTERRTLPHNPPPHKASGFPEACGHHTITGRASQPLLCPFLEELRHLLEG
jgi:hypothetical protein